MKPKLQIVRVNTPEDIENHRIDKMPCELPCPRCKKVFKCLDDAQAYFEKCSQCYEYTKPPARKKKAKPKTRKGKPA